MAELLRKFQTKDYVEGYTNAVELYELLRTIFGKGKALDIYVDFDFEHDYGSGSFGFVDRSSNYYIDDGYFVVEGDNYSFRYEGELEVRLERDDSGRAIVFVYPFAGMHVVFASKEANWR